MIDDAINIAFEPSDPDVVWEHYLETCRQSGVAPVCLSYALFTHGRGEAGNPRV